MAMLVQDAMDMIARNERSLAATKAIAARMMARGEQVDISAHEEILEGQKAAHKFGRHFYYDNARDADFFEEISVSGVMARQSLRRIADDNLRAFKRKLAKRLSKEESR